jgi:hypothetical protein
MKVDLLFTVVKMFKAREKLKVIAHATGVSIEAVSVAARLCGCKSRHKGALTGNALRERMNCNRRMRRARARARG